MQCFVVPANAERKLIKPIGYGAADAYA